jgi:hypothetical protein
MLLLVVLANTLLAAPLWAVDYDEVDRSITKEPVYRTGKPEYALLLFGPEARRRVWVVVDGETIYVDRNSDGDLTAPDERFEKSDDCKDIEFSERDGKTWYVITNLRVYRDENMKTPPSMMVWIDMHGPLKYRQYCDARLGKTPSEAALAHFHGPLAIGPSTNNYKVPAETVLTTGDKPGELQAFVGTMSERHKCWVAVVSHTQPMVCAFADGVRPKVTVEFPPKDPGAPPIIEHYSLDEFC